MLRRSLSALASSVPRRRLLAAAGCLLLLASCSTLRGHREPPPPPPPPPGHPLTPEPTPDEEPLPVKTVSEPIVVAAWAEPRELPHGGGEAQILVRVQRPGGKRFPGVEVRLRANQGSLYSGGR